MPKKTDPPKAPEKKKTAIALPMKTWEAARIQATKEKRTFQELVAEAVDDYIKKKTDGMGVFEFYARHAKEGDR